MDDSTFLGLAESLFRSIEDAIEASDAPVEPVREGNVLRLELDNGEEVVLNLHTPTHEVWLASRSGGSCFIHKDSDWVSTRTGEPIRKMLNQALSARAGEPIELA